MPRMLKAHGITRKASLRTQNVPDVSEKLSCGCPPPCKFDGTLNARLAKYRAPHLAFLPTKQEKSVDYNSVESPLDPATSQSVS